MAKKRAEVREEDKWNVEAIYSSDSLWESSFNIVEKSITELNSYKGRLHESALTIKEFIEESINIERELEKLYIYAHMKNDEDGKNSTYKNFYDRAFNLSVKYDELTSWVSPELLAVDDSVMAGYLNSSELAAYRFYLEKILRNKPHVLSQSEERLLSMAGNAMATAYNTFSALNDADLKFGSVKDSEGNEHDLTHGQYYPLLINKDRTLRENAFKSYHNKFEEFSTTMASLLSGQVKGHQFTAESRNFSSCLESSLFYKNIDTSVYINLVNTVRERIGSLHKYLEFRRERMGLEKLHIYDLYIPFVEYQEITLSYDEARELVCESSKALGNDYYEALREGLYEGRWVDKYENENKRSGAYSTGCYDSLPYILMNYNGTLSSARTLAHEAGHSMHSYLSHKSQPPVYGNYPIFLAEVASTFNEELFNNYLLELTDDNKRKAYLINSRIEEIRSTLFRQTMFAEFELKIHQLTEQGVPLTAELLNKEYRSLNEFYFGSAVVLDKEIDIEWAKIPHFYYNFYVYQYATGISAAISLAKRVTEGGDKERGQYLNFLKSGCSKYPIETLIDAGVDMRTAKPINDAIDQFDNLLEKLKEYMK